MKINTPKLAAITLALMTLSACQETPSESKEEIKKEPQQTQEHPDKVKQDRQNQQAVEQLRQEEKSAIEALEWAQSADLDKEYNEAIEKKDFRVWMIAGRGASMPGIDSSLQAKIDKNCGHKYLPGVGDILRGDTHRAYRKKAVEYAEKYNQKMQTHCLSGEE
ncbi:hypothetical protein [Aliikangiella coralliicola]|uniref:Lipoprotein n=1 Tax=Aliikangiella coralliicola TaxID=2592383 RepID=A0A545UF02_9GAMM|nr:hypothetical protein [Aliikangiella coralliicola]TQV88056.1 hypothetical protein FLL46_09615 [Aliikangiella coralliicola]